MTGLNGRSRTETISTCAELYHRMHTGETPGLSCHRFKALSQKAATTYFFTPYLSLATTIQSTDRVPTGGIPPEERRSVLNSRWHLGSSNSPQNASDN